MADPRRHGLPFVVRDPTQNDITMGQGGTDYQHVGNVQLRKLALVTCDIYEHAPNNKKQIVASTLVSRLRGLDPPGRFLKRDDHDFHLWHEVEEEKAVKKVQQVYREAIQERKMLLEIAAFDQTHLRRDVPLNDPSRFQQLPLLSATEYVSMEELGHLGLENRPRNNTGGSSMIFEDIPSEIIEAVDRSFFNSDGI